MNRRVIRWGIGALLGLLALTFLLGNWHRLAAEPLAAPMAQTVLAPDWTLLSSSTGDLPSPAASNEQTAALLFDVDGDGRNDFVLATRRTPGPSLLWYQNTTNGWRRHVVEPSVLNIEAGGAYHDVDGDGDPDIVMGGDSSSNGIWWWENPLPGGDPTQPWTRRVIKDNGDNKHHDLGFADVDNDGQVELVFWNQRAQKLFLAEIPANPRQATRWFDMVSGSGLTTIDTLPTNRYEGLAFADIDQDGITDIVAAGAWYKRQSNGSFSANVLDRQEHSRLAVGQLVPGGRPEIIQAPGDADGLARWYEWNGSSWTPHDLTTVKQAHSLALGDVNQDGHLDIFIAEMQFDPTDSKHNPNARTLLFYGDSTGNFTESVIATGLGNHESRLGDLDADGDLDILVKPYTWNTPRVDILVNQLSGDTQPPQCTTLGPWQRVVVGQTSGRNVFVDTADLDGDGDLDIVSGSQWYRNPGGTGPWQASPVGGTFNQFAATHDFDGDGDIDLLGTVSSSANANQQGNAFVWARNDGSGTFEILDNIAAGTGDFLQGVVVGDFNGGLGVALSWHGQNNNIQLLTVPADPATTPWPISTLATTSQNEDLSRGDIDRDGDGDLLLGTLWLEDEGAGQWTTRTLYSPTGVPDRNELVDVNGDGRLDAVVGYEAVSALGKLAWYEAPQDPTQLWTERVIADIIGPMSVGAADLDGDGDTDIIAGEHHPNNPAAAQLLIYENKDGSGGSWNSHIVHTGDEHHDGMEVADLDRDGDLDLVSIGWTHGRVHLYRNNSCGQTPPPNPTATSEPEPTETPPPNPTATSEPEPTATPPPNPTATSEPEPTETPPPTVSPTPPPQAGATLLLSSTSGGNVGGVSFADEDILAYDPTTGNWTLWFDGSDVGLAATDINAFTRLADGRLLFSFDTPVTLSGVGQVDDSDLVVFTPTTLGSSTSGTFALFLRGSGFGLTTNGEDIDAAGIAPNGDLIISVTGWANASGITAQDEDLIRVPLSGSRPTANWSLYFDGSDVSLSTSSEDIAAAGYQSDGSLLLSLVGQFAAGGVQGTAADIIRCLSPVTGKNTRCDGGLEIAWRGSAIGFGNEAVDALAIIGEGNSPAADASETPPATSTPPPGASSTPTASPTATAVISEGQCAAAIPGNVITNPSYEAGQSSWLFNTNGAGTFATVTGGAYDCQQSALVTITLSGSSVQLYQSKVALQPSTPYRLTLAARALNGGDVKVSLHKHTSPYTNYGLTNATLDLRPQWQVFQIDFVTNNFASPVQDGRLRFWLADSDSVGEQYSFDLVSLVPLTGVEPTATQPAPPTATPPPTATATPSPAPTASATPPPGSQGWAFADRSYRVAITIGANGFARGDKPVDVPVDFAAALAMVGATGSFAPDSLRVAEVNAQGQLLSTTVPFQFDPAPTTAASGNLVLMLTGETAAESSRYYHVYFDVAGSGFAPHAVTPWLTLAPNEQDEGFASYRINTPAGTYYYHKQGGGFSSLVDANGNDWIGWNAATGSAGDYRGIPNMVHPNDGGFFHPGRTTSSSTLVSSGPLKVTIRSTSNDNGWQTQWEIYPTHARLTVLRAATNYYILYEGVPGGALDAGDVVVRPNGDQTSALSSWTGDLPGEEWVYFRDATLPRALFAANEQDDTLVDSYRQIQNAMTVFGFGRDSGVGRFLSQTPRSFVFGLLEETNHDTIATRVRSAYRPVSTLVGGVEVLSGGGPPAPTPTPTPPPGTVLCTAPIGLDQWQRHVIDTDRPGQATFMFDFDVNGDGRRDIITGQFWYENVSGVPGGQWTRHPIGAPLTDVIAAHDFDGDGDTDLLGTSGSTIRPNGVWAPFAWARNDGGGNFTVLTNIDGNLDMPPNDPVQGVAIARFTPGGPLQVAITWDDTERPKSNPHGIQLLTVPSNPSTGTWTRQKLSDFSLGEDVVAADVDDDGDIDLFIGEAWLRNNHPANTWTTITIFNLPPGYQASRQELLDMDNDGDLDAVIGYSHAEDQQYVMWYEQGDNPEAPWTGHLIHRLTTTDPRGYAESMHIADMDGDGDTDVIIGEYRIAYRPARELPASLLVMENLGNGASWRSHVVSTVDSHYQSSQAADIDGDGDLDIISKGWVHYRVHIYENKACNPP